MVGEKFIVCMRVQSSRPKELGSGETGWLHPVDPNYKPPPQRQVQRERPNLNAWETLKRWNSMGIPLAEPAKKLGVTVHSLTLLGCTLTPKRNALAFPMFDDAENYIGIRIRTNDGQKFAEPGSRAGLFIPASVPDNTIYVVEGPTDTAAMLTIGLWAIGRPSCSGGIPLLQGWLKRNRSVRRVVILADVDQDKFTPDGQVFNPGIRGAKTLQEHLPVPSVIVTLPAKDPRDFLHAGGTATMVANIVNQLVWHQPK